MESMEKLVTLPERVEDLSGLYIDLKRASFQVKNVGADPYATYVYLDPEESKDPLPIVREWVGRIPPAVSDSEAFRRRIKDLKEAIEFRAPEPDPEPAAPDAPAPAEDAAPEAVAPEPEPVPPSVGHVDDVPVEPTPAPAKPATKPGRFMSFVRRILG